MVNCAFLKNGEAITASNIVGLKRNHPQMLGFIKTNSCSDAHSTDNHCSGMVHSDGRE